MLQITQSVIHLVSVGSLLVLFSFNVSGTEVFMSLGEHCEAVVKEILK